METSASIHFLRNATFLLNYAGKRILVDPMFFPKGAFDPIYGRDRNPVVDLPVSIEEIIKDIDLVLVTHTHPDHFDPIAGKILDKAIKIINQPADKSYFEKANFTNAKTVSDHLTIDGIDIYRTGGQHGSGEVLKHMGTVSGFVLKAEHQPTVYIVGDSIYTEEIKQTIEKFDPAYIVVNSGGAVIPGYESTPILMDEEETVTLVKDSHKAIVIAVHMEALDHCLTTRTSLRQKAEQHTISSKKLIIPEDGDWIYL